MEEKTQTIFWPNGAVKRVVEFKNNQRSGFDRIYNQAGHLVDEAFFDQSFPIGIHRRFDQKGNLIEEVSHLEKGRFSFRLYGSSQEPYFEGLWLDKDCYVERSFDKGSDLWVEKKGCWDGKKVVFPKQESLKLDIVSKDCLVTHDIGWKENFQLFFEKNPSALFFIPMEERTQMQWEFCFDFEIGKAQTVFIYGLGLGGPFFQLQSFLRGSENHKIVFLEDDESAFCDFLNTAHAKQILNHKQVFIEFFQQEEKIFEKYIVSHCEFVKIPSKDESYFQSLKNRFFQQSTLRFALMQERLYGDQILENFLRNLKILPSCFYVNLLKNAFSSFPIIVCGAGPSLNDHIPILKEVSKNAIIIAAGSAIAAMSAQNVDFHFAVAIDPNLEEYRSFRNNISLNTCLLTSLRVHPDVFQTCNGPFGYMRAGVGGILEVWLEEQLQLTERFIGEDLSSETMSVTGICVALAEYLGSRDIYLCGVDLAYVNGNRYADHVVVDNQIEFQELDLEKQTGNRILQERNIQGDLVYTATRWIMERNCLSDFAKNHPDKNFYNIGSKGLDIEGVRNISSLELSLNLPQIQQDISSVIKESISKRFFAPDFECQINGLTKQLQESLGNVVEHLLVLNDKKKGSLALAELLLKEELSYTLFFFDIEKYLTNTFLFNPEKKWVHFLDIAQKFYNVFGSL